MSEKKGLLKNENQMWNWMTTDGKIKLKSRDLCFDTFEQQTINGTAVIASKCSEVKTQLWTIEEIKIKSFFIQHVDSGL